MTHNDEFIGQLESYLDEYEGSTPLPEDVRDAIRAELPSTRQRPPWWPARRSLEMNNMAKLGIAAAAVVVAALLGYNYFVAPNVGGPGLSDPTPTPIASTAAAPMPGTGPLEAGSYRVTGASFTRVPFTVTVPDGWGHEDNFIGSGVGTIQSVAFEGDGVYMASWLVSHVYADSCDWEGTLRPTTTANELITALAEQTGHDASGPIETELGGRPATRFDFSVAGTFDISACDSDFLRLWPDAGPNENLGLPIAVGQTASVYVVDLESGPMVLIAGRKEGSSPSDVSELEAVMASIRFEEPR